MANRPLLRRRGNVVEKKAEVKKPVVVEAEDDEELDWESTEDTDDDAEDTEDVEDDDDAEVEEPVVVRRNVKAPTEVKKVVQPPAVKKVEPVAVVKKVAKPVVAEPIGEDDNGEEPIVKTIVKPVDATAAGANMLELLIDMNEGQTITITRTANNKWTFGVAEAKPVKSTVAGLHGNAYWTEVISPQYTQWYSEWKNLTHDERIKKAKKAGVSWKEDKDPRVNIMRCTEAYRIAMDIEKYKPEYKSRSARATLQGK